MSVGLGLFATGILALCCGVGAIDNKDNNFSEPQKAFIDNKYVFNDEKIFYSYTQPNVYLNGSSDVLYFFKLIDVDGILTIDSSSYVMCNMTSASTSSDSTLSITYCYGGTLSSQTIYPNDRSTILKSASYLVNYNRFIGNTSRYLVDPLLLNDESRSFNLGLYFPNYTFGSTQLSTDYQNYVGNANLCIWLNRNLSYSSNFVNIYFSNVNFTYLNNIDYSYWFSFFSPSQHNTGANNFNYVFDRYYLSSINEKFPVPSCPNSTGETIFNSYVSCFNASGNVSNKYDYIGFFENNVSDNSSFNYYYRNVVRLDFQFSSYINKQYRYFSIDMKDGTNTNIVNDYARTFGVQVCNNSLVLNDNASGVAYNDGYTKGYNVGYTDGESYGETVGYSNGYQVGYRNGLNDGTDTNTTLMGLFGAIADTPVLMIRSMFNFDLFGVNVLTAVLSLLTAIITIYVIRKFI